MNELLVWLEKLKKERDKSKYRMTKVNKNIEISTIEKCLELLFKGWKVGDEPYYINDNEEVYRGVIIFFEIDATDSIASVNDGDDQEYLKLNNLFKTKAEALAEIERRTKND